MVVFGSGEPDRQDQTLRGLSLLSPQPVDNGPASVESIVDAPEILPFQFDYPALIFDTQPVSADRDEIRTRLQRVYLYRGRCDVEDCEILETACAMMAQVGRVHEWFARHRPQYEILNVSLLGSYLWVQRPHDIDFNVVVRGDALELLHFRDAAASTAHTSALKRSKRATSKSQSGSSTRAPT